MVAEGNCFVVYMYENTVQSSLNLRSEQRFYFISPYLLSSSVLYQLLQQLQQPRYRRNSEGQFTVLAFVGGRGEVGVSRGLPENI
jgi:hypothetical protein